MGKKKATKRKAVRNLRVPATRKIGVTALPISKLRWKCPRDLLPSPSTLKSLPLSEVAVQKRAIKALRYGLESRAPGHHIFVRGSIGTGRLTVVRLLLEDIQPSRPPVRDHCYVHNFSQPDRPRLVTLPAGKGRAFKKRMDELAEFIGKELGAALSTNEIKAWHDGLRERARARVEKTVKPLNEDLAAAQLILVPIGDGTTNQGTLFPVVDGEMIAPEELEQLCAEGEVPADQHERYWANAASFEKRIAEINQKTNAIIRECEETVGRLKEESARRILSVPVGEIKEEFPNETVHTFLDELVDDLVENRLKESEYEVDFTPLYRVNMVLGHEEGEPGRIIAETPVTVLDLIGMIDVVYSREGSVRTSHMGIRAGTLLRADGGFLIIDADDIRSEPEVWKYLVRTLRTGNLEIVPQSLLSHGPDTSLKPEPIPIDVKIILIGDPETYKLFDTQDRNFPHLFKVLADFDSVIPRNKKGVRVYAEFLARLSQIEQLPEFSSSAVAVLAERGVRIAGKDGMLTTNLGRLGDAAFEAAHIARQEKQTKVTGEHVRRAVRRARERADLPARQFRKLVAGGKIQVLTEGSLVGQINGLAVMTAGMLTYGFPARITATIGPGTAGVINIEREADLSGSIHTKGFYILSGLLRYLLRTEHPLAFNASVAFEQSYGGIDGDSASGAEICCLLSALTEIPLRQDLAMTGAIDQRGNILEIGSVNQKIEGFFDVCYDIGLKGTQGLIIPHSNVGDLMLREDVVAACKAGQFRIYGVKTISQALELLTGISAGVRGKDGAYPKNTILGIAMDRAFDYWVKGSQRAKGDVINMHQ